MNCLLCNKKIKPIDWKSEEENKYCSSCFLAKGMCEANEKNLNLLMDSRGCNTKYKLTIEAKP